MGMLSGISNAETSQGGNYIKPGVYLLSAEELKGITSRKGKDFFVGHFGIIESNNDDAAPGGHVDWMANLTDHDAALGNVKSCLSALAGIKPDELEDADAEEAIDEDVQPLAGRLVKCEATQITTKAGNPFTKCFWTIVDDETQKKADELRKKVGLD